MSNIIETIKLAAMDAVQSSKPMDFVFGVVSSQQPLAITVDQKFTLSEEFLILTRNVTDYHLEMTMTHTGGGTETRTHEYSGTVHNGLKAGERVVMMRAPGGQRFIVVDRLG